MLNTKYQSSMPSSSEEKNFEDGILCSYVQGSAQDRLLRHLR